MKSGELITAFLLALCIGVFIGWYSKNCPRALSVCYNDLAQAVGRGVILEADLDLCRQGK